MEILYRLFHALTELHPLHPMLVHFPIGLSGAAALFIILAVWKRNLIFEQAAYFNLVLVSIATLVAGSAGIYDNNINYDGDAPNALAKIILASALLGISTITSLFRWQNPNVLNSKYFVLYVGAYLTCFLLALVLAFLGGVILYGF